METTNTVQRLSADGHGRVHVGNNYNSFQGANGGNRSRILQDLYRANDSGKKHANNYESHKERNPKPEHGTCQWFLKSDQYMECRFSPSRLVDELRRKNPSAAVYHFFFRDDNSVQAGGLFALRALLHQLLVATDAAPRIIAEEYNAKRELAFSDLHKAHETLALRCVWYLLISNFAKIEIPLIEMAKEDRELAVHSLIENHPFLDYASNY